MNKTFGPDLTPLSKWFLQVKLPHWNFSVTLTIQLFSNMELLFYIKYSKVNVPGTWWLITSCLSKCFLQTAIQMTLKHTTHIQKPSVDRYKSKLKHHKQVDYSLLCVMYTIVPCTYMTGPTNNSVERDCQGFGCQPLRYWEQTGYRGTKWSLKRLKDQLLLLWHKGNSRGELLSSLTEVNLHFMKKKCFKLLLLSSMTHLLTSVTRHQILTAETQDRGTDWPLTPALYWPSIQFDAPRSVQKGLISWSCTTACWQQPDRLLRKWSSWGLKADGQQRSKRRREHAFFS